MKLIHIQLLFFITSYVLFSGCKQKSPNEIHIDGHSHHIKIHYDTLCIMKENLTIVGGSPSDFSILNDSSYLLSIGKDLLLYNKQGEQTKIVGNYGEGPGEYLSPDRLFVSSKFIYVWCKQLLKLITYDLTGHFVKEYRFDKTAIVDFAIWEDQYVCFLLDGHVENKKISIYNLSNGKEIKTICHENKTDDILFISKFAGGLSVNQNRFSWIYPSKLQIHSFEQNLIIHSFLCLYYVLYYILLNIVLLCYF